MFKDFMKGLGYLSFAGLMLLVGLTIMFTVNGVVFVVQRGEGNKFYFEGQISGGDDIATTDQPDNVRLGRQLPGGPDDDLVPFTGVHEPATRESVSY